MRVRAPCAVFCPAGSSAAKEHQATAHPDHVLQCRHPFRVMLKAFATGNNIKAVVMVRKVLSLCDQINISAFSQVNANIQALLKELSY